jgi:hypothetical protein
MSCLPVALRWHHVLLAADVKVISVQMSHALYILMINRDHTV